MLRYFLWMCLLGGMMGAAHPAYARDFAAWKSDFAQDAIAQGIDAQTLSAFMDTAEFLPKVIELDRKQPEHKISYAQYSQNALNADRINQGRAMYQKHRYALARAQNEYGVPAPVIVALWGMETNYGGYMGDWGVLSTLATLAYEGRRASFFRTELLAALRILQSGDVPLSRLRGSWAGAMGQCQFMPSSYLRFAKDGNNDGRRDIWGDVDDVFASAGHYLQQSGWDFRLPWGSRVTVDHPLSPKLVGLEEAQGRPADVWKKLRFIPQNEKMYSLGANEKLWLVAPDGLDGQKFLVTRNYQAIMKWNKSTYFASSVGRLADEIARGQADAGTLNQ